MAPRITASLSLCLVESVIGAVLLFHCQSFISVDIGIIVKWRRAYSKRVQNPRSGGMSAAVGSCHHARGGEPGERGKEERSGERPKAAARPPRGGDVLFGTDGGRLGVGAPCRPEPRRPGVSHALFLAGKRV